MNMAINRDEFFQFIRCITYFRNLMAVFTSMDTNNDRRLNKAEFMSAAAVLEVDDAETVFAQMDENNGGYIVFDEFCIWMAEKRAMDVFISTPEMSTDESPPSV